MANKKNMPAEVSDALQSGFKAAMDRVKMLKLDPCGTLVDQIPQEVWNKWDASGEVPTVIDSHGLEDDGIDEDAAPVAA